MGKMISYDLVYEYVLKQTKSKSVTARFLNSFVRAKFWDYLGGYIILPAKLFESNFDIYSTVLRFDGCGKGFAKLARDVQSKIIKCKYLKDIPMDTEYKNEEIKNKKQYIISSEIVELLNNAIRCAYDEKPNQTMFILGQIKAMFYTDKNSLKEFSHEE